VRVGSDMRASMKADAHGRGIGGVSKRKPRAPCGGRGWRDPCGSQE